MKLVLLFSFLLLLPQIIIGQTAEEIICKTEDAYRKYSNYVDKGKYTRVIYSNPPLIKDMDYFLAIDRAGNIHHWISGFELEKTSGAEFVKSASDSLGKYSRIGTNNSFFFCSPFEASARLVATGGGILYLIGSLFYAEFIEGSAGDDSIFQSADTSVRLADTIIYDASCYVIENSRTHLYTQQMADQQQQRFDSINRQITWPEGFTPPSFKPNLGPKTIKSKYYIRAKDFLIVRREEFQLDSTAITSKTILIMDPMHDLKDITKHLQK